jgi:hypothetical protein
MEVITNDIPVVEKPKRKRRIRSENIPPDVPRDKNGRYIKGHSGFPGGRNSLQFARVSHFAKAVLGDTFNIVKDILDSNGAYQDVKAADKLKLIFEIWNRAEGKVATQLIVKQEGSLPNQMNCLQIDDEVGNINKQLQDMGVIENETEDS